VNGEQPRSYTAPGARATLSASSEGATVEVPLAADTIDRSDLEALAEWILSGNRLTKGPETLAFEREFADAVGSAHAVFVNSGSSANLLMLAALKESGRLRNNVAIAPAVSWVTTVSPFLQLGFETHLCDADPMTLGLDIGHLRRLVEEHEPSVLILVHVLGHPNRMREIVELCQQHDILLLEDACEALGSIDEGGRHLGSIGLAGSYSLFFGHHLSTIEGGMVVTDDDDLHRLLVALRSHGWSRDLEPAVQRALAERHGVDGFRDLYTFYRAGYNLRSTDLQAFIGRRQLKRLDAISEARSAIAALYREALTGFYRQTSTAALVSEFAFGTLVSDPPGVAERLRTQGVESRPLICGNIGRHPFWTDRFGPSPLPVADQIHDFGMYLPIHASMTSTQVAHVVDAFLSVAEPHELLF